MTTRFRAFGCWALLAGGLGYGIPTTVAAQAEASATVSGIVTGVFEGRRTPVPNAVVRAVSAAATRTVRSAADGGYRIEDLASGTVRISVSQTGHETLEVDVVLPAGAHVRLDLELRARPLVLDPLEVTGDRLLVPDASDRDATVTGDDPELEMQALDITPGVGSPGLLDAVASLPGNDPADATDVLYMRGATTDLKLVLLDGAPVYTPFHVAGLLKSFEPAVLGNAELHVGGAPARYDGGLTHILDIETRRPRRDRVRGSGSLDLLSASTALEGGLGRRGGFLVSARSLHDLGTRPLGGDGPYGYQDALATAEWEASPGQLLRATGFWNSEAVHLDFPELEEDASWSNRALALAYRGHAGATRLRVEAAVSGYAAALPLQPTAPADEPIPPALLATAQTDRLRLTAEATWGAPGGETRFGVTHDRIDAAFDARRLGEDESLSGSRSRTAGTGGYIDATRRAGDGVTVRLGLRADRFAPGGVRLAPRAALVWEFGPEALLTIAAGRYHQPTRTPDVEVERTLSEVVDDGLGGSALLPVATADHVVLALDQRLAPTVRMGLEGFWKRYEGLEAAPGETIRSSGVDLRLRSTGRRAAVWVGYGLSWFWSTRNLSGYASDFAGRHLLSAGLSGAVAGPLRAELRVAYGAGLPYTAIPFRSTLDAEAAVPGGDGVTEEAAARDSPLVGGLDEEFLRIDLEVHARWDTEWGGRRWALRPYVRLLNALDRRDALFYTFQPWRGGALTPLAERPLLPVLGIAVSF